MPFYKIYPLPMPPGYSEAFVSRINDHGRIIGSASKPGSFQAVLWNATAFSIVNIPGTSSSPTAINAKTNIVGQVDGKPFFWRRKGNATTILKDFSGSPATKGIAWGLNDHDQITGLAWLNGLPIPAFWNDPRSIPVNLFANANLSVFDDYTGYQVEVDRGVGVDIGKDGTVVGDVWQGDLAKRQYGFIWDSMNGFRFLPKLKYASFLLNASNDSTPPQIACDLWDFTYNRAFLYDVLTSSFQDLGLPNETSFADDINKNSDVVGSVVTGSNWNYPDLTAVLWSLNGLVRTDLNHPTISDAQAKGWQLFEAVSINSNGEIIGNGFFGGDTTRSLPWLLKPLIPIHKIPIEYMLPHYLWPGEAYDGPRPGGWPTRLPFPIPLPNPFQIVGRGATPLNNLIACKEMEKLLKTLKDDKGRAEIKAILDRIVRTEMKNLNKLVTNSIGQKKSTDK